MHTAVLVEEPGLVSLAMVAIVALLIVFLAGAGLVAYLATNRARTLHEPRAPEPLPEPRAGPRHVPRVEHRDVLRGLEIDVPTKHADHVLSAFQAVGWDAVDTGTTVATDEGEEELTTLRVDVPFTQGNPPEAPAVDPALIRALRHKPAAGTHRMPSDTGAAPAQVRGDLIIEDGYRGQGDVTATGNVVVGTAAQISGRVRAGGTLRLGRDAVVGTAACGRELYLEEGARVLGTVEAGGGIKIVP